MTRLHAVGSALGSFVVALMVGCGSGSGNPTAPVTGKLTCKGAPVVGARVIFVPAKGRPGTGTTDANGSFTLSTFVKNDGAELGEHKVSMVMSTDDTPPPMPGTPQAKSYKPPVQPFADRYLTPQTSKLTAKVEKGKKNTFEWDLEPK
jgi:hypothetical protein